MLATSSASSHFREIPRNYIMHIARILYTLFSNFNCFRLSHSCTQCYHCVQAAARQQSHLIYIVLWYAIETEVCLWRIGPCIMPTTQIVNKTVIWRGKRKLNALSIRHLNFNQLNKQQLEPNIDFVLTLVLRANSYAFEQIAGLISFMHRKNVQFFHKECFLSPV